MRGIKKIIFDILDSRVVECTIAIAFTWALFETGLFAASGMFHFDGLGFYIPIVIATLWIGEILFG